MMNISSIIVDTMVSATRLVIIVPLVLFTAHYLRRYGRCNGMAMRVRVLLLEFISGVSALMIYLFVMRIGTAYWNLDITHIVPSAVVLLIQMYILSIIVKAFSLMRDIEGVKRINEDSYDSTDNKGK